MWTRYIDMCGEIDEEITVPELVKEGSLCPHQDYVYFNYPTNEEQQKLIKELKSIGFIEKNQVTIVANQALEKMLVKSAVKCESIKDIIFHEYSYMQDNLRFLTKA